MEILSFIISLVGTLAGIAGLIISFLTWKNTKNIVKEVAAAKIKEIYPQKHNEFVSAFENASISLSEGGRKYYIVSELLKTCRRIQKFYDNWDTQSQKAIDTFTNTLNKVPANGEIDDATRIKLQKELFELQSMIERIGNLNGIGQN